MLTRTIRKFAGTADFRIPCIAARFFANSSARLLARCVARLYAQSHEVLHRPRPTGEANNQQACQLLTKIVFVLRFDASFVRKKTNGPLPKKETITPAV